MSAKKDSKQITSVLVADDHAVTRFGLSQFLRATLGATGVHEVQTFGEALRFMESQKVDLAIFDLGIPGLGAPRLLTSIRDRWPSTKVVVLSGSSSRNNILAALEAGVHGYIVKTETMDGIADKLGYVLSGEIYVPSSLAERGTIVGNGFEEASAAMLPERDGPRLTERQRQVLELIVKGLPNKQIASELNLALGTVKMHVSAVMTALGAKTRLQAAAVGRKLFD
jgi:DNA-binding NarL/FixJ family response regulator